MRCMMCGDDMVLTHAVPAETGGVQGFETQTHQCPACLGTERRFIFVGAKTDFIEGATAKGARAYAIKKVPQHANGADKSPVHHPRSSIKLIADPANKKSGARHDREAAHTSVSETTLVPSEPSLIESVIPLNAGNAPGQSWVRAVEKFRRYEADLHERVEKTKTTNPNLGAKASEPITVPANDQMRRVTKSHDAPVRERLGRRPPYAGPQGRAAVDHEALRRFDELWMTSRPHVMRNSRRTVWCRRHCSPDCRHRGVSWGSNPKSVLPTTSVASAASRRCWRRSCIVSKARGPAAQLPADSILNHPLWILYNSAE